MTRKYARRGLVVLLFALTVVMLGSALPALAQRGGSNHAHQGHSAHATRGDARDLARARAATFKYRDVDAALAAGYVRIPIKGAWCVEHATHGSMGIHYLNPALVDGTLNPTEPELLLYFPTRNGLRLVGVEYFTPDTGQAHPTLFNRELDGPNSTLEPEIPRHYSLHAWLWYPNPSGVFSPYNPNLDCA
jgi:hypothetical protein